MGLILIVPPFGHFCCASEVVLRYLMSASAQPGLEDMYLFFSYLSLVSDLPCPFGLYWLIEFLRDHLRPVVPF